MTSLIWLALVLLFALFESSYASIELPTVWSNGAVMQRNKPVELVGWSDASTVSLNLINPSKKTVFSDQAFVNPRTGSFSFVMPAFETDSEPYTIVVSETSNLYSDVDSDAVKVEFYFGDVILCSGYVLNNESQLTIHL